MSTGIKTPASYPEQAQSLVEVCHFLGARQWAPATAGNFSARIDANHCLVTQSGCDKAKLTLDELMVCDLHNLALDPSLQASAELALHTRLYRLDSAIGAVLHTHSVTSTVLSRAIEGDLLLQGFEMQKALRGNQSHEPVITLSVFDNHQDMSALADVVEARWSQGLITQPGFLLRGHGLYAWGKDVREAKRHIEAFEFLFACAWQEKLLERS
ncbi:MAG TPA: methylthioribulose 1-phosphate dehydratase [Pseudomonadales bacterium]